MSTQYGGLYKATVVGIEDPERRHRVQVHVVMVHSPDRTPETCPWAESCAAGGKGAGSFFSYRVGELVWVMFENGDPDYPVIVGAQNTHSLGVPDEPVDKQSDYAEGLRRWSHVDRKGNVIEMSEVADELHVRIKSGSAEIKVTQMGDEVVISAPSGKVRVESLQASVTAGTVEVKAGTVDIDAQDFSGLGVDNGKTLIAANDRVEINAQDSRTGVMGEVSVGGASRRFLGVPIPPGVAPGINTVPKQTPRTNIRGRTVNVGGGVAGTVPPPLSVGVGTPPLPTDPVTDAGMDFDFLTPLLPTVTVNIRAQSRININSGASTYIQAATDLHLVSIGGVVTMSAPVIQVSADGALTLSATGVVNLTSSALVRIASTAALQLEGTAVNIQAGA